MMNTTSETFYPSLYEAAVAMGSAHSPREILRNLVERVTNTLGAKGCSLMLLSPDKKHLFHIISYGLSDKYIKKGPVLTDKSISEVLEGKIVGILNATEDERIQYPEQAEQEGIASILAVPMTLRDEIIGVIRIYTSEPHQFTMDEMYFTSAIASLSAIAFENARLYNSVRQDNEKLKQELRHWNRQMLEPWMDPLW
jgi:GAF domain-containing protein